VKCRKKVARECVLRLARDRQPLAMGFKSSSGRAPLLAPSPLRTGLEGFPFIRLEHPKTPPMNNADAA